MKFKPPYILDARILIVDDQAANVSLLEQLLADAGYTHVSSTMDPHEVCALHRENRYDLILLDLQMPVMSGREVLERLHARGSSSRVLPISGFPPSITEAMGLRRYVRKPFGARALLSLVRETLDETA